MNTLPGIGDKQPLTPPDVYMMARDARVDLAGTIERQLEPNWEQVALKMHILVEHLAGQLMGVANASKADSTYLANALTTMSTTLEKIRNQTNADKIPIEKPSPDNTPWLKTPLFMMTPEKLLWTSFVVGTIIAGIAGYFLRAQAFI